MNDLVDVFTARVVSAFGYRGKDTGAVREIEIRLRNTFVRRDCGKGGDGIADTVREAIEFMQPDGMVIRELRHNGRLVYKRDAS